MTLVAGQCGREREGGREEGGEMQRGRGDRELGRDSVSDDS